MQTRFCYRCLLTLCERCWRFSEDEETKLNNKFKAFQKKQFNGFGQNADLKDDQEKACFQILGHDELYVQLRQTFAL